MATRPAFHWQPVLVAWLLAIGVDLFFNAGLFSGLFDQAREPSLLPDDVLFRRIPVAYAALLVGVAGLAWLIDRLERDDARGGVMLGAVMGVVVAALGVVNLWTAVDMTLLFLVGAAVVQIVEFGAAGALLAAFRTGDSGRLTRLGLLTALLLVVAGIVAQNLSQG